MGNVSNALKDTFINYGIKNFSKQQLWKDDLSLVTAIVLIWLESWYIDVQITNNTNYPENFNNNPIRQSWFRQKHSHIFCKTIFPILFFQNKSTVDIKHSLLYSRMNSSRIAWLWLDLYHVYDFRNHSYGYCIQSHLKSPLAGTKSW